MPSNPSNSLLSIFCNVGNVAVQEEIIVLAFGKNIGEGGDITWFSSVGMPRSQAVLLAKLILSADQQATKELAELKKKGN